VTTRKKAAKPASKRAVPRKNGDDKPEQTASASKQGTVQRGPCLFVEDEEGAWDFGYEECVRVDGDLSVSGMILPDGYWFIFFYDHSIGEVTRHCMGEAASVEEAMTEVSQRVLELQGPNPPEGPQAAAGADA